MATGAAVGGRDALVDGRVISHPTAGGRGVGRYTIGFVRAMVAAGLDPVVLHTDDTQAGMWADAIPGIRTAPLGPAVVREAAASRRWFVCTQLMLHPVPLDVVPRIVTESGLPVAAIIHDVIPQRHPERYLTDPNAAAQTALRTLLCRTIDRFCANSTFTADTASVELGVDRSRFHVVGAAIEPQFTEGAGDPVVLRRLGAACPGGPVVAVTGADSRKNTDRLIAAWARIPAGVRGCHRLVVACAAPPSVIDHWHHLAVTAGIGDEVVFTGAIDDDEMVGLLRGAVLTVLPSIEEGFGLPIVESVACGTPALCSHTSSMPEVSGSPDAGFDPFDVEDIAGAIGAALIDPDRRDRILTEQRVRARRWTVDAVGDEIATALDGPVRPASGDVPARVAVAAPHPASPSGIGAYTANVLDRWSDPSEIVLLDETGATDLRARSAGAGFPVAGVPALGRSVRAHDVDHLIAVLGSSPHHAVTLDRIRDGRCHLWIHEPTAVGTLLGPAHLGGTPRWLRGRLDALGIADAERIISADAGEIPDAADLHAAGATLLEPFLVRARSIVVSSVIAAERLAATVAPSVLPPILVLPLAHPPVAPARLRDVPTGRLISLGWIEGGKDPDRLLRLVAEVDATTLDLVGGGDPAELDRLRALAARLGVGDRVRVHGRVSDADRDALIAAADLGVQLRRGHPGQMSAAVTELLAAGVPVITTLRTHGTGGDGLVVIDDVPDLDDRLAAAVRSVLGDPAGWRGQCQAARERASDWGFGDVAASLATWLHASAELRPGTVLGVADLRDGR
jgi:glycosyltransferase involved in cell wall biosynthesis